MLPAIARVLRVEMLADGGSLQASFQAGNGAEYWLLLRLRQQRLASGKVERLRYGQPLLVELAATTSVELTWPQAQELLEQIRLLMQAGGDAQWLDAMQATASAQGALPPQLARFA